MRIETNHINGDNKQLRQVIFKATPKAIKQTKTLAKQFKGKTELDTCRNIFNFLKNKITYVADGQHQKVKLPSALLRERVGDCKSYSVFTAAILSNLGIGCKYVLTSYSNDPTPTHIYVQTNSGIIIDAVYGKFNAEKVPAHRFTKTINGINDMRISTISGIKSDCGMGDCGCQIGGLDSSIPSFHRNWKSNIDNGLDWYRTIAVQGRGKKALSLGAKAEWRAKQVAALSFRAAFLGFIRGNGGGIADSMYNALYRVNPVKLPNGKTIQPLPKSKQIANQKAMEYKWFWMGGNPPELTEAILEGITKQARGKDANYMLAKAKTRGLKAKDAGLIIRGMASGFFGNRFEWGSKDSQIYGVSNGIGLTGAEVAAWVTANMPLLIAIFELLKSFYASYIATKEAKENKREIDKLLEDGWIYQQDYAALPTPRPPVKEQKVFSFPSVEVDLALVTDIASMFKEGDSTAQKLKDEAKTDKNTSKFLQEALQIGELLQDKIGETKVVLVKTGPLGKKQAGAGGIILPLLIGGGVLMALNKAKK